MMFLVVTEGLRSCSSSDDAGHPLLAERHEYAPADYRRASAGDTVGKRHVQRHSQCYVAEFGH